VTPAARQTSGCSSLGCTQRRRSFSPGGRRRQRIRRERELLWFGMPLNIGEALRQPQQRLRRTRLFKRWHGEIELRSGPRRQRPSARIASVLENLAASWPAKLQESLVKGRCPSRARRSTGRCNRCGGDASTSIVSRFAPGCRSLAVERGKKHWMGPSGDADSTARR
jgi:hypothetical protein